MSSMRIRPDWNNPVSKRQPSWVSWRICGIPPCGEVSNAGVAERLTSDFTVYNYDRRGRGDSEDTLPYAVDREIERAQRRERARIEHADQREDLAFDQRPVAERLAKPELDRGDAWIGAADPDATSVR